jgi:hypothetical protein
VVSFTPLPLNPRGKSLTHWRAGLDDLEKRKFFTLPDSNSDPSVVQPVASRYTDYATPAPSFCGCSPELLTLEFQALCQSQPDICEYHNPAQYWCQYSNLKIKISK